MIDWLRRLFSSDGGANPLGQRGENLAARFLRNLGYKIMVCNFRCNVGEIDIIARDGDTLVFVEVKTRTDDEPTPEEQINRGKRHRITKAAKSYLRRYGTAQPGARFDVVAVVWPKGQAPQLRHIRSAFEATF